MATEVNVTTWAELSNALNSKEDTDIYLMNDIDLNDELPEGVTAELGYVRYKKNIYGENHTIKNVHSDKGISIFNAYSSSYVMSINDVNLINVYLTNSSKLSNYVTFNNCIMTAELVDSFLFLSQTHGVCNKCGITVTGYESSSLSYQINSNLGAMKFEDCNIELNGSLAGGYLTLKNSYLSGSFEKIGSEPFGFGSSSLSIINADIKSDVAVSLANTASSFLVNTDKLAIPEGSSLLSNSILCTTEKLKSAQALRDKGFPIGVD